MNLSIFNLFNIGIGPSSSHTVGPMKAARFFVEKLILHNLLKDIKTITVEIYGSLAATGKGHATDKALVLGFLGYKPSTVDTNKINEYYNNVIISNKINLLDQHEIIFVPEIDIIFKNNELLPYHPNGMLFKAYDINNKIIYNKIYYSTGGGYLVGAKAAEMNKLSRTKVNLKYPYRSAKALLDICKNEKLNISDVVFCNELYWRTKEEIYSSLDNIWNVMQKSIINGCNNTGYLPGSLKLQRRANIIYKQLKEKTKKCIDPLEIMDWVNLFALAVNEENAAGARVVTAPTNGSAGVIPAVINYYLDYFDNSSIKGVYKFLLTAGGIGLLYKINASLSGAEVGCQGEVGVACSMAAAGLTEVLGGNFQQVENAAEIGMEHNLGLTCDPIDGLVQVPCIERNAMGAIKAINASRIAMMGDGKHHVSLDMVIKTMMQTGMDMKDKYKETSLGGLAINITEC